MLRERARLVAGLVAALDLALVAAAFVGAHWLRGWLLPRLGFASGSIYPLAQYLPLLPLALGIWALLLWSSGRYRSHRTVPIAAEAAAVLRAGAWAAVVFALALFVFRIDERLLSDQVSRSWFLLFALGAPLLVVAEKVAVRLASRQVRARGLNFRTVVVVGTSARARSLSRALSGHRYWGFRVLGHVESQPGEAGAVRSERSLDGIEILGRVEELPRIAAERVVDEVIFTGERGDLERFEDLVLALQEQGIVTRFALNFFPHAKAKMHLEELDGVPLVTFTTSPTGPIALLAKRLLDVGLAAILLVVGLPVLAGVALAIRATSGGGVLFRQRRCGLNGRVFTLYKFRTMVEGAEARRAEVEHLNEMQGPVFKATNDPRVTRLGRFLRKFSLDELPQFWNVLTGDMSLVGPRPPIPEEVTRYERWQRRRLAMKPGLTCLWQISGRNEVDFDQWMKLDLEYIDSWSPWLDLKILAKTVPVVLSGRGAS